MKKNFRNIAILSAFTIGASAVVFYYQMPEASEGNFCERLVGIDGNKRLMSEISAADKASFNGNAYRYGTETKYFLEHKICSENSSKSSCWNDLVKSEIITVKDKIELSLAMGAVLHDCSKEKTDFSNI